MLESSRLRNGRDISTRIDPCCGLTWCHVLVGLIMSTVFLGLGFLLTLAYHGTDGNDITDRMLLVEEILKVGLLDDGENGLLYNGTFSVNVPMFVRELLVMDQGEFNSFFGKLLYLDELNVESVNVLTKLKSKVANELHNTLLTGTTNIQGNTNIKNLVVDTSIIENLEVGHLLVDDLDIDEITPPSGTLTIVGVLSVSEEITSTGTITTFGDVLAGGKVSAEDIVTNGITSLTPDLTLGNDVVVLGTVTADDYITENYDDFYLIAVHGAFTIPANTPTDLTSFSVVIGDMSGLNFLTGEFNPVNDGFYTINMRVESDNILGTHDSMCLEIKGVLISTYYRSCNEAGSLTGAVEEMMFPPITMFIPSTETINFVFTTNEGHDYNFALNIFKIR